MKSTLRSIQQRSISNAYYVINIVSSFALKKKHEQPTSQTRIFSMGRLVASFNLLMDFRISEAEINETTSKKFVQFIVSSRLNGHLTLLQSINQSIVFLLSRFSIDSRSIELLKVFPSILV